MQERALASLEGMEYTSRGWQRQRWLLPEEVPLTVYVNGEEVATLMASPHAPLTLALGFLAGEGWIQSRHEVAAHRVCPETHCVDVWLTHPVPGPVRRVFTSGCTGGLTLDLPDRARPRPLPEIPPVAPHDLMAWMREMQRSARLYRAGRGIHAAGLVLQGQLRHVAEDVGRHNAVDRVRGWTLLQDVDPRGGILLTTGRISVEMALKAARMGCPVVASRTAATSLAVHWARQWGLTLVTYLRGGRFRVYTHPQRLAEARSALPANR